MNRFSLSGMMKVVVIKGDIIYKKLKCLIINLFTIDKNRVYKCANLF